MAKMAKTAKKIQSVVTLTFVPKEDDMPDDAVDIDFKIVGADKKSESAHDVHVVGQFLHHVAVMVMEGDVAITEIMEEWMDRYGDE